MQGVSSGSILGYEPGHSAASSACVLKTHISQRRALSQLTWRRGVAPASLGSPERNASSQGQGLRLGVPGPWS